MVAARVRSAGSAARWIVLGWIVLSVIAPALRAAQAEVPAKSSTALRPSCDLPDMFRAYNARSYFPSQLPASHPPKPCLAGRNRKQRWLSSLRVKGTNPFAVGLTLLAILMGVAAHSKA